MADSVTPSSGTVTPSAGSVTPSSGTVTPSAGIVTPVPGNILTAAATETPSAGTVTPSTGDAKIVWGDKWREELAGGDAKKLSQLQRYTSPSDYVNATFALRQKMDSGELKAAATKPPDNATPEQLTAWRKENGIPEKAEGYLEGLPEGMVIGDADKKIFDGFAKSMHDKNMPPAAVHAALSWYYSNFEQIETEQLDADKGTERASEDAMRSKWGNDYRTNVNAISSYLSTLGATGADGKPVNVVMEALASARAGDGTPVLHKPEVLDWLASLARERGGVITVPSTAGMSQLQSVDGRIAEIEGMMKPSSPKYREYVNTPAIEKEYRDLIAARDRLKPKAA